LFTNLDCCCLSTGIATLARQVQAVTGFRVEMHALVDTHARRGRVGWVDEARVVRMKRRSPRITRFRRYPVAAAHEGRGCRPSIPLPSCAGCVNGELGCSAQRLMSNRRAPCDFVFFLLWLASILCERRARLCGGRVRDRGRLLSAHKKGTAPSARCVRLPGSGPVVDGQHLGVSSALLDLRHPGCALLEVSKFAAGTRPVNVRRACRSVLARGACSTKQTHS